MSFNLVKLCKKFLAVVVGLLAIQTAQVMCVEQQTNSLQIPLASNLANDGVLQQSSGKVILLYVSAPHCAFCKKLEKEILMPLLKSGEYQDRIILRKINWRSDKKIIDFNGEKQLPQQILKKYNIRVTPTLLFLNSRGLQVGQQLLGYRGGEFYWFYFDSGIKKANLTIKYQLNPPSKTK